MSIDSAIRLWRKGYLEQIGEGSTRKVYGLSDSTVLKFGDELGNRAEHSNCKLLGLCGLGDWIAPVLSISDCGLYLIMARTKHIERMPNGVAPECFKDVKKANFGMLDNRLVCHDYEIIRAEYL